MKIWKEYEKDVYKYFNWFNDRRIEEKDEVIDEMSVFSINVKGINSHKKSEFIEKSSDEIVRMMSDRRLSGYKIYLFVNVEIVNQNSKVEHYMKAWKHISKKYDVSNFVPGEEVLMNVVGLVFYSSIAEIPLDSLDKAMEIVISNPDRYTLFISKSENLLMNNAIQTLFDNIMKYDKNLKIDYYAFSVHYCNKGNIIIRFGTDFTNAEFALIYDSKNFGGKEMSQKCGINEMDIKSDLD